MLRYNWWRHQVPNWHLNVFVLWSYFPFPLRGYSPFPCNPLIPSIINFTLALVVCAYTWFHVVTYTYIYNIYICIYHLSSLGKRNVIDYDLFFPSFFFRSFCKLAILEYAYSSNLYTAGAANREFFFYVVDF